MAGQTRNRTVIEESPMTPEIALNLGTKIGIIYGSVAIARDMDPSSDMIAQAVLSGLMASGASILDMGNVPVPVAVQSAKGKCKLVVSIGNPDREGQYSTLQIYDSDGTPVNPDKIREISRFSNYVLPDYKKVSTVTRDTDCIGRYIQKIKSCGCTSQGYIILDCGCETTSNCAPQLLAEIGADVVAFNTHTCMGVPPRAPGVSKTNLMNISNFVNASIGSVGIAFNGDGTKLALMDESGKFVPNDRLIALMMMYYEPHTAVVPFDSPRVIEDAFNHPLGIRGHETQSEERKLVRTKNDLDSIIASMKDNDADIGILNDGTFIFSEIGYCPDALYASALISELAGKRSIRNVLEEIPVYSNRTLRMEFDGNIKVFGNKLRERISLYDIDEVCSSDDAWRMILKKGTYTIKQSETDPTRLIVFAESSDVVYLITMLEQAKDIIGFCI